MTLAGLERVQLFCALIFLRRVQSLYLHPRSKLVNLNIKKDTIQVMKPIVKEMKNIDEIAKIIFFKPELGEEIILLDRVSEVVKEIGDKIDEYRNEMKGQRDPERLSSILEAISYLENLRKVLID